MARTSGQTGLYEVRAANGRYLHTLEHSVVSVWQESVDSFLAVPGLNPMPADTTGLKYVRFDGKFTRADTSGLKAVVGSDRAQTFDVPLK